MVPSHSDSPQTGIPSLWQVVFPESTATIFSTPRVLTVGRWCSPHGDVFPLLESA